MKIEKIEIAGKKVMPFTIPSGIVMTDVYCAERLLKLVPEIGVWTSKSIGVKERVMPERDEVQRLIDGEDLTKKTGKEYGFREPILAQIGDGSFVNAVRLINPGMKKFREHLLVMGGRPHDRVRNCSVFGGSMVNVIKTVDDVVDMHEGNGSCPHSEKGGMLIGTDPKLVYEYTKACVAATKKPFLFKLTPNTDKIGLLAKAVQEAGGAGVVLINTVGPYIHYVEGSPVLTSKMGGGKSGQIVRDRGTECVREARQAVGRDFLIVGMGGIQTARDVKDYQDAGANLYGIGSALAGMNEQEISEYFPTLIGDLENCTNHAEGLLKKVDMSYRKVTLDKVLNGECDLKIFRTFESINAKAGQFVFAWIPGIGEKPFSIMDDNPLTLGVQERGYFTNKFNSLKRGDQFYIRGPYGNSPEIPEHTDIALVGGGCGIAGLYLFTKQLAADKKNHVTIFLGAKDGQHLPYTNEFGQYGYLCLATEDGSVGKKGRVIDLLNDAHFRRNNTMFFNCGPRAMVEAVLPLEIGVSGMSRVYSSVDYMTKCGVGICGSCADAKGRRTCVEGPFMNP
jgi:dihydroorotate dehydrogenase/NAD(P)H-flavin reductase